MGTSSESRMSYPIYTYFTTKYLQNLKVTPWRWPGYTAETLRVVNNKYKNIVQLFGGKMYVYYNVVVCKLYTSMCIISKINVLFTAKFYFIDT
jgi:hypothetical protein